MSAVAASFSDGEYEPPIDMLHTAGFCALSSNQVAPATIAEMVPVPSQLSARIDQRFALLATPMYWPPGSARRQVSIRDLFIEHTCRARGVSAVACATHVCM